MMKSLDAHYAKVAWKTINSLDENQARKESFKSVCKQFPSLVKLNGLRLTLAFFEAKKAEHKEYCLYLTGLNDALGQTISSDSIGEQAAEYRRITEKVMRASIWFKRYAESMLDHDVADEPQEAGKS